ncbi:hypothetical protein HK102_012069 [Quaeritorhiza haematococci]|nr:hypothetical protein HK102_012069 [Quaeritorhiza haematococci]
MATSADPAFAAPDTLPPTPSPPTHAETPTDSLPEMDHGGSDYPESLPLYLLNLPIPTNLPSLNHAYLAKHLVDLFQTRHPSPLGTSIAYCHIHKDKNDSTKLAGTAFLRMENPDPDFAKDLISRPGMAVYLFPASSRKSDGSNQAPPGNVFAARRSQIKVKLDRTYSDRKEQREQQHLIWRTGSIGTSKAGIPVKSWMPSKDEFIATQLQLGTFLSENLFLHGAQVGGSQNDTGVIVTFEYSKFQQIVTYFHVGEYFYKMQYRFQNVADAFKIERKYDLQDEKVHYFLTGTFSIPPRMYYQDKPYSSSVGSPTSSSSSIDTEVAPSADDIVATVWSIQRGWKRLISASVGEVSLPDGLLYLKSLKGKKDVVENVNWLGRWPDHRYQFTFPLFPPGNKNRSPRKPTNIVDMDLQDRKPATFPEARFLSFLERLEEFGLVSNAGRFVDLEVMSAGERVPYPITQSGLEFRVVYQVLCMITANMVSEYIIDDKFVEILRSLSPEVAECVLETMRTPRKRYFNPTEVLCEHLRDQLVVQQKVLRTRKLGTNLARVRKIVITPSKVYLTGPHYELTNRILRTYPEVNHDFFMRVSFCDEDFQPVTAGQSKKISIPKPEDDEGDDNDGDVAIYDDGAMGAIYQRIEAVLEAGVTIMGRNFEFLHYSNSQLRGQGCWFYHSNGVRTATDIRNGMGDFNSIRNPAKFAARMAQCFSSTAAIGVILSENIKQYPDVERNGYVFSDGVGRIGVKLAEKASRELRKFVRVKGGGKVPSAYQVFIDLKNEMVSSLNEMHTNKWTAIRVLTSHGEDTNAAHSLGLDGELDRGAMRRKRSGGSGGAIGGEPGGVAGMLVHMIRAGFFEMGEPYLVNLLKLFHAMQGRVVITRSPCLHPGDIRVVEALGLNDPRLLKIRPKTAPTAKKGAKDRNKDNEDDVPIPTPPPHLECLVDVVAFSQHGTVPLPQMIAGGDLDGDTFFVSIVKVGLAKTVTYDERLIPPRTVEPMDYSPGKEPKLERDVKIEDVKKHFVNYLRQNNLGQIANAWLGTADRAEMGALDPAALALSELHSLAVDFPKRGVPAVMERGMKPREWPDFMEKHHEPMYQSKKAIGVIYRSVKILEGEEKNELEKKAEAEQQGGPASADAATTGETDDDSTGKAKVVGSGSNGTSNGGPGGESPVVSLKLIKDIGSPLPVLIVKGYERYLEEAVKTKVAYDRDLQAYGIGCELELVSGYILRLDDYNLKKKPQELKEQIMETYWTLKRHYRDLFFRTDPPQPLASDEYIESLTAYRKTDDKYADSPIHLNSAVPLPYLRRASAWYVVTYDAATAREIAGRVGIVGVSRPRSAPTSPSRSGSDGGSKKAEEPNAEQKKEDEEAAKRRKAKILEHEEKEHMGMDLDMDGQLVSFPWVMFDVLCNILRGGTKGEES